MALTVADSDVLIDALRGREPSATRVREGLRDGTLATTAVNAFELQSGARTALEQEAVAGLLGAMSILPLDAAPAERAARCRRDLEASGRTIGMGDLLIAGICLDRSAVLLTRSRSHFDQVAGLVVGDP
jgi:predicted nucleic acid-binding protein